MQFISLGYGKGSATTVDYAKSGTYYPAFMAWATQLKLLMPTVLRRLNEDLGSGTVTVLEVVGPHGPSWKKGRLSDSFGEVSSALQRIVTLSQSLMSTAFSLAPRVT